MEDAVAFEQEQPPTLLPNGISVSVTYATLDYDPGDPEVGPRPTIEVGPVYVEVRNSAMGEIIVGMVWQPKGGWHTINPNDGRHAEEVIRDYFAQNGDPRGDNDRMAVMQYLYEGGLI